MQQLTKKQKLTLALNKKQDEDLSEVIKPYDKRNPNYIEVNDWVFFNDKVGQVSEIAADSKDLLQFWIAWQGEMGLDPVVANLLQKLDRPVGVQGLNSNSDSNKFIHLTLLKIDPNLQQRVKLDEGVISDYAFAYSENQPLPPITCWNCTDDNLLYLVDGFHRVEAAKIAGLTELPYIEKVGTYREAVLFSIGVNSNHGLRRSNADKRKAVFTLFKDPEWSQLSTRELAKIAHVSHQLVHNLKEEVKQKEKEIEEKQIHPSDAINLLDDIGDDKDKQILVKRSLPSDVKPVDKKQERFTISIQKTTLLRLKEYLNDHDLSTAEGAILRLLGDEVKAQSTKLEDHNQ